MSTIIEKLVGIVAVVVAMTLVAAAAPDRPRKDPPGQCPGGVCELFCADGLADCNGRVGDRCEVALRTDESNCGACGVVCGIGQYCSQFACIAADAECAEAVFACLERRCRGACHGREASPVCSDCQARAWERSCSFGRVCR